MSFVVGMVCCLLGDNGAASWWQVMLYGEVAVAGELCTISSKPCMILHTLLLSALEPALKQPRIPLYRDVLVSVNNK